MCPVPADRESERGAALLTVLLIVAVVAVMAGAALEKLRLTTRLAGNAAVTGQARGWAYAAETMALSRVSSLLARSPDRVTLAGGWSDQPYPLPLPGGGLATARVTDGGNCFNLNGLVSQAAVGTYVMNETTRTEFARLMRLLQVPAGAAEQIAASTADWIDTDQQPQPNGAEDPTYLARAVPYRTAGTLMGDPSELRAVAGMTPEIYATLRPWVCTLPMPRPSRINLNTLSPERAPLIAMLAPDTLSVGAVQAQLVKRPPQGFADSGGFWQGLAQSGGAAKQDQTGVTTTWFDLRVDVSLGGAMLVEHATIDATRLPARLVSRQWGDEP
ncbi:type II secretion system minor pseudopilin GspK [Sphingomonas sp. CROZ-RG-20F-R02-07]|uniref:type II secretion system minor pseudopilin GspK n=1 Tax=Sphingomonas sp. CROZ-RG-20F-R02-07 TaxID=2914832 RepID=UPI001F5AEFC3|nr:type II secretion system minor pseudopilin GspK [Sphingomonas sp. CROZ-RG-20F-R02-07]